MIIVKEVNNMVGNTIDTPRAPGSQRCICEKLGRGGKSVILSRSSEVEISLDRYFLYALLNEQDDALVVPIQYCPLCGYRLNK